eukprot:CAMPEP_0176217572 /NCGR_PEP_ID=MMETSP0121_2-20121125/17761_1 /TAXON_ID=160619 /ORGANISM="Kryptoperidinium foliaceum, Strain CCMP 1326" /LENGTH=207 /DNA_ID=CAMNT_0017556705 /DNA_START=626 /DNA_END=1245 /DNA_ORIENTATION=-
MSVVYCAGMFRTTKVVAGCGHTDDAKTAPSLMELVCWWPNGADASVQEPKVLSATGNSPCSAREVPLRADASCETRGSSGWRGTSRCPTTPMALELTNGRGHGPACAAGPAVQPSLWKASRDSGANNLSGMGTAFGLGAPARTTASQAPIALPTGMRRFGARRAVHSMDVTMQPVPAGGPLPTPWRWDASLAAGMLGGPDHHKSRWP